MLVVDLRRRIMLPALTRAELPTSIRTYDTRHSSATMMIDAGYSPGEQAARMGHADGGTTALRFYYHARVGRQQDITNDFVAMRRVAEAAAAEVLALQENVVDIGRNRKAANDH
jgi:integrase